MSPSAAGRGSTVSIAIYYIWSAELTETYGVMPVAAWNMLVGLVTVLPLAGWEIARQPVDITAQALAAVVYLGVVVTVIGLILWLYLLKIVPARIAASVQYLQPVFGIGASAFLFGNELGLLFAAGVALVLAGLALAALGKRIDAPESCHHWMFTPWLEREPLCSFDNSHTCLF